ncbi:MAG: hypothetical protein U1E14_10440 [Geminicoccaceae bacterium]
MYAPRARRAFYTFSGAALLVTFAAVIDVLPQLPMPEPGTPAAASATLASPFAGLVHPRRAGEGPAVPDNARPTSP